jgi:hypothetical protein
MRTGTYITPHELINPKLDIRLMNNELIQVARFEAHVAALLQAALLRYQFKLNFNTIWAECIPQLRQAKRVDRRQE